MVEADLAPLHHVDETPWGGHQQVTASIKVAHLGADVRSTVHHTWTHTSPGDGGRHKLLSHTIYTTNTKGSHTFSDK